MPQRSIQVRAHAASLLRNVLAFFADETAFIQELLQNARRAEASRVEVAFDTKAGTLGVSDDGSGVADPELLLSLGESSWPTRIKSEQPAGLGVFSCFKPAERVTVRSGRWRLDMDWKALLRGNPAALESMLPAIKGTTVTLHGPLLKEGDELQDLAREFGDAAEFMPFSTTITVDGAVSDTIKAFDSRLLPFEKSLRVTRPWGLIDLCFGDRPEHEQPFVLVTQGLCVDLREVLPTEKGGFRHVVAMRVVAEAGALDFALPDRDRVLVNEKRDAFARDVIAATCDAVIERVKHLADRQDARRLAGFVYGFEPCRVVELPDDLQVVEVDGAHGRRELVPKLELARRLREGAIPTVAWLESPELLEFLPCPMFRLCERDVELFRLLFPDVLIADNVEFRVTADPRGLTLWKVRGIELMFANDTRRTLAPRAGQSALVARAFDAEFVADGGRKVAERRDDEDWMVVHTCDGQIALPDTAHFEETVLESSSDEPEQVWRTSACYADILDTWPGIPANDLRLDEFDLLMRRKLAIKGKAELRFRNADFNSWDGITVNITAITVEVFHEGERTRQVHLVAQGDPANLRVVSDTGEQAA